VVVALGDSATLRGPSGLPSLPVMASLLSIGTNRPPPCTSCPPTPPPCLGVGGLLLS
jgi:hypothetical protein